jgi:hypothetical protein
MTRRSRDSDTPVRLAGAELVWSTLLPVSESTSPLTRNGFQVAAAVTSRASTPHPASAGNGLCVRVRVRGAWREARDRESGARRERGGGGGGSRGAGPHDTRRTRATKPPGASQNQVTASEGGTPGPGVAVTSLSDDHRPRYSEAEALPTDERDAERSLVTRGPCAANRFGPHPTSGTGPRGAISGHVGSTAERLLCGGPQSSPCLKPCPSRWITAAPRADQRHRARRDP